MEKLVESLVEEQLDETPITPLSTHPSYKPVTPLETPGAVQNQLKSLIVQVLREANSLPTIPLNPQKDSNNLESLQSKTYEDILATTILNKIVEKCQHTKTVSSTTRQEDGKSVNTKVKATCEFQIGPLGGAAQTEEERKIQDGGQESAQGVWREGRSSLMCTTVEHIEEVITRYLPNEYEAEGPATSASHRKWDVTNDLDIQHEGHRAPCPELGRDIVDGSALLEEADDTDSTSLTGNEFINDLETWEENWLFQKKRGRPHNARAMVHHPVPVPMLVPCPAPDQTCRTLIGDVDAEDTSDLSECSDSIYDDPIFSSKTRSLRTADSQSPSLKVKGSSSSEDEDNTEAWVEARNEKLLLATPVDSGEGSLEVTEEDPNLPQPNERTPPASSQPMKPVPKPRKTVSAQNMPLVPNGVGSKPPTGLSNKHQSDAESSTKQTFTKVTGDETTDFIARERAATIVDSVDNDIHLSSREASTASHSNTKRNGVIPNKDVELKTGFKNSETEMIENEPLDDKHTSRHLDNNQSSDRTFNSEVVHNHTKKKQKSQTNIDKEQTTKNQNIKATKETDIENNTKTDGNPAELKNIETDVLRSQKKPTSSHEIENRKARNNTNNINNTVDENKVKISGTGDKTLCLESDSTNFQKEIETDGKQQKANRSSSKESSTKDVQGGDEAVAKESYDREHEAEVAEIEILNTPPKPGTIAEREHAKWLKGIPLENNPYSKENIEKRNRQRLFDLSRNASSDQTESNDETESNTRVETIVVTSTASSPDLIKRYSRDYYINNSSGTPSSRLSSSNTSLSSIGKALGKSTTTDSTSQDHPQRKCEKRSKDTDDLKRPPNVSVHVEVDLCRWQSLSSISSSSSSPLTTPPSFNRYSSTHNIHRTPSLSFSSPTPFQRRSPLSLSTQNIATLKTQNIQRSSPPPVSARFQRSKSTVQLKENRQNSFPDRRSSSPDQRFLSHRRNSSPNRQSSSPNRRSSSPPSKPRVSVTSWSDNAVGDWGETLPSVKRLAAQYVTSQENLAEKPQDVTRVSPPKCLNIVTKSSPIKQVHSLTARSISKEFREGLKQQKPAILNKNNLLASITDLEHLKVTTRSDKQEDLSDDSGTVSPTVQFYENKLNFWQLKTAR